MKKINIIAKYYETNEWAVQHQTDFSLKITNCSIGITDFAQTVFGNINFLALPKIGESFQQGQPYAVVESTKTATDISMPLSGKIIAVNESLLKQPALLNKTPYECWLVKIAANVPNEWDQLMTAEQYLKYIGVFFNKER